MKVKNESEVAQLCPTLRDPMDCSLPGSSIHGISQARVLDWAAIAFSNDGSISILFSAIFPQLRRVPGTLFAEYINCGLVNHFVG